MSSFPVSSKPGQNPFTSQAPTVQKAKPRGGWDDDEDQLFTNPNAATFTGSNTTQVVKPSLNVATGNKIFTEPAKVIENVESSKNMSIMTCDDAFFNDHAHETKIISEMIQPGGARLKQSDAVLNDFCKACASLQTDIVGSVLFFSLGSSTPFVSKARSLFAIEALVKKVKKYNGYFNHNQQVLASSTFSEESSLNANQLKKVRDDILNFLNGVVKTPQPVQQVSTPISSSTPISKQANIPSQPQSAQIGSVGIAVPAPISIPNKPISAVPTPMSGTVPQSQAVTNQAPSTAKLPSQSKPNPFGITSNGGPNSAAIPKPSSGLPGAFKSKSFKGQDTVVSSPAVSVPSQNVLQSPMSAQPQSLLSEQLNHSHQAVQSPQEPTNSLINSLSAINFGDQDQQQQNFNGGYQNQYNNTYNGYSDYNGQNFGQPSQPSNMMGYPGPNQYNHPPQGPYNNYPNQQYNDFNGQYNSQQYPPQPQQFYPQHPGQYPAYYNYPNQMQGSQQGPQQGPQQGQMYYQGPQMSQQGYIGNQYNQPNAEQQEVSQEELAKREQQKMEEWKKKKQQEENEKRFEALSYLI